MNHLKFISQDKYAISILGFFIVIFLACRNEAPQKVVENIRPVKYQQVVRSNNVDRRRFSGVVKSSMESKMSFKVAGTINQINVKVGDRLRTGQLIARIDATDYNVNLDQAVAQLKNSETQIKKAETNLNSSKSNYLRIEKLYENNSVPLSEYEQAKANFEAAQSQYDASIAQTTASNKQVESAGNQVQYTSLLAPFSGVITQVAVEENEMVGSGSPIATLSSEEMPEVAVDIPETFISNVDQGKEVLIHFSAFPDKSLKGKVTEVAYSSSDGATFPVIIQIEKRTDEIRPGMAATVEFLFGAADAGMEYLIAPIKGIGEDTDGHFAFLLQKSNEHYIAQKKYIKIGKLLNSGFEVKEGLQENDLLATAGLSSLLDGMKVKLME